MAFDGALDFDRLRQVPSPVGIIYRYDTRKPEWIEERVIRGEEGVQLHFSMRCPFSGAIYTSGHRSSLHNLCSIGPLPLLTRPFDWNYHDDTTLSKQDGYWWTRRNDVFCYVRTLRSVFGVWTEMKYDLCPIVPSQLSLGHMMMLSQSKRLRCGEGDSRRSLRLPMLVWKGCRHVTSTLSDVLHGADIVMLIMEFVPMEFVEAYIPKVTMYRIIDYPERAGVYGVYETCLW